MIAFGLGVNPGCAPMSLTSQTIVADSSSLQSQQELDVTTDGTAPVAQQSESSAEPSESDVLVQEPALRSVRKMEFSSGARQPKHRSNYFVLQAFNEAIGDSYKCTVQLMHDGDQCALGTIVDTNGWIVSKASELQNRTSLKCLLNDDREIEAKVVGTDVEMDVALLKISASNLTAVQWDLAIPEQGRWLATTDLRSSVPTAIGVVSAGPTRIPNQRAVLGVLLDEDAGKKGAVVSQVLNGSGAHDAGIRERDYILSVDGKSVDSRDQFLNLLKGGKGGQYLTLKINRDENMIEKQVRLMDLSSELLDETEMEVNGPISARSTGFGRIFMHDTVILPNQCGGPLVNLDGKVVGINIARAGRVSTYALPADTIMPIIKRLMQNATVIAKSSTGRPVSTDSN
jgi:serine protease Do